MDVRFALRSLWKNPGFAVLSVLVMGLGIGANTAVFSVVNSVLLRSLDYKEPGRIVSLNSLWKGSGSRDQVSGPDFQDWHDQSTAFSAMAYYQSRETSITAGRTAEYAEVCEVTSEFAGVFDLQPAIGRWFNQQEIKTGGATAAVISYGFWQSHFGGKPEVLGQTMRIFGRTLPIIGVLPPRFQFPGKTDVWYPANPAAASPHRSGHNYLVVGRLKPTATLEEARAQMVSIAARLEQQYPASNKDKSAAVTPLLESQVGDLRFTLYILLGAVTLVLLISCANVANLLLAKATSRTREIAVRAAVGASRSRIVRQLITESAVLAVISGLVGVLLANWGSSALVALAPKNLPRLEETAIDGWVLAFTFGVSVVASLLFGLAPALQASRVDLNHALKQGTTRSMGGGTGRLRNTLVVAEVALSVVLLAGAGLLIKSFAALSNVNLGFRPENLLVMSTSVPSSNLETARRATKFHKDLLPQIAAIPGVTAVGGVRTPPGRIVSYGSYFVNRLPGPEGRSVSAPQAVFSVVTPGAFNALGVPIKAGRDFHERDTYDAPFTAIINEALAKQAFPGQDPIGRILFCGFDSDKPMQIVGIVGDVRQAGPAADPRPEIYMPYEQHPRPSTGLRLIVRTTGEPTALAETIGLKTRELSTEVPLRFTTMEASLAENVAAPRFRTLLFGVFAGLAVCLAMAGVYGVMAYSVGQRSNEIGLRMALGASPSSLMGMVLRQGLMHVAIGLAIGLGGAIAATRLLTKMLFEVKPTDPATYAAVAILLTSVAAAACYFPARRATKVDPLTALRQE